MNKPYSSACDNNKTPIFNAIKPLFNDIKQVLEIGSGTGQHAVYFAEKLPGLNWQTSDRVENHTGIRQWIEESGLANVFMPIELDVTMPNWPDLQADAAFTANTCHIMHWYQVLAMFEGVGKLLQPGNRFIIYGPFNYQNAYTSDSNQRFDAMLRQRDPDSGLRNIEDIKDAAIKNQLIFNDDMTMPANNRLLVFQRH